MSENKEIISYHTFMFPFIIENDFNLKSIAKILKKEKWINIPFKVEGEQKNWNGEKIKNYNEYAYFYPAVQKLLYNQDEKLTDNELSSYFEYKDIKENEKYKIRISDVEEYALDIVSISLRIFSTGVGILSFHLENFVENDYRKICRINEFGRRIYPQFIPLEKSKGKILANELQIGEMDTENFENYLEKGNIKISKTITNLLGNKIGRNLKSLIDDRMFTLCWYGNTWLSREMGEYQDGEYKYLSNSRWAEYLFVDGDGNTCQSKTMLKKLLEKHSYDRWIEENTIFGITRYSFVVLTNEEWFPKNILLGHVKTMYYQLVTICLMQRATILNFKHRITAIVSNGEIKYSEIKGIQKDYLKFINSMCFREITAQEQGIELYNMAKDIMGIDEALRELEDEISELHNYHAMIESEKVSKNSENFALIAGIIVIPTVLLTLLSNSSINISWLKGKGLVYFGAIIPIAVTTIILKGWYKSVFKWLYKVIIKRISLFKNIKIDNLTVLIIMLLLYLILIA